MSTIRISQVVAFSRTHSVHLNPQIEGTEIACPQFSGGRFCQVVARTGLTVLKLSRSFYLFRGCVCTDFRVYSGVGVVGVFFFFFFFFTSRK